MSPCSCPVTPSWKSPHFGNHCFKDCCLKKRNQKHDFRNDNVLLEQPGQPQGFCDLTILSHSTTWCFTPIRSVRATCQSHTIRSVCGVVNLPAVCSSLTLLQWHKKRNDGLIFSQNEFQTQVRPNWKPEEQSLCSKDVSQRPITSASEKLPSEKTSPPNFTWYFSSILEGRGCVLMNTD